MPSYDVAAEMSVCLLLGTGTSFQLKNNTVPVAQLCLFNGRCNWPSLGHSKIFAQRLPCTQTKPKVKFSVLLQTAQSRLPLMTVPSLFPAGT